MGIKEIYRKINKYGINRLEVLRHRRENHKFDSANRCEKSMTYFPL